MAIFFFFFYEVCPDFLDSQKISSGKPQEEHKMLILLLNISSMINIGKDSDVILCCYIQSPTC